MPTSLWFVVPVIVAIGVGQVTQNVMNSAIARSGGVLAAVFISVAVTFALLLVAYALGVGGIRSGVASALHAPPYLFMGGVFGFASVLGAVLFVPKIGGTGYIAVFLAGQLVGSLLLDQVGAFGLPRIPITPVRIIGALLLFGGARLVLWK